MTAGRFSRNGLRYAPTGTANELISDVPARCRRGAGEVPARCRRNADVNRLDDANPSIFDLIDDASERKLFPDRKNSRISTRGNAKGRRYAAKTTRVQDGAGCGVGRRQSQIIFRSG